LKKSQGKLSPALAARLSNRLGRSVANPPLLVDLEAALANAQKEAEQCAADVSRGAVELLRLQELEIITGANHGDAIGSAVAASAKAKTRGMTVAVELGVLSKLVDEARERQTAAERAAERRRHEKLLVEIDTIASELDADIDDIFERLCRLSVTVVALRSLSGELASSDLWKRDFLVGVTGRRIDALVSGRRDDTLSGLAPTGLPSFDSVGAAIISMVRRDLGLDVGDDESGAHAQETEAVA
jgi:hypothetical protein